MSHVDEDIPVFDRSDFAAVCYNKENEMQPPKTHDKVFREECAFTFDSPLSENGIYTNMKSFYSVAHDLLLYDHQLSGCEFYVHQKWTKSETQKQKEEERKEQKLSKVGIGVEGGAPLDDQEPDYDKQHSIVVIKNLKTFSFDFSAADIPQIFKDTAWGIVNHDDASRHIEVQQAAWEEEIPKTKYADSLEQLSDVPKISPDPSTWKCQYCDMTENLWLNLSTGFIGCGRRQFDGSGGNSHALQHYEETGKKYPLCVKLGTITPDGRGDCFSYAADEDSLIENPKLPEHLKHFGIEVKELEKTEKTMAELTLDLNQRAEFNSIQEEGSRLLPVTGPGFVGMKNLGNSCYMNSAFQVLLSLPEFQVRLLGMDKSGKDPAKIFGGVPIQNPPMDIECQLKKLAFGLYTDRYVIQEAQEAVNNLHSFLESKPSIREKLLSGADIKDNEELKQAEELREQASKQAETIHIAARMLKAVVGRNHPEFATNRQQDAAEFLQYILETMERVEKSGKLSGPSQGQEQNMPPWLSKMFSFEAETRTQCQQSHKVRYTSRTDNMMMLPVPKDYSHLETPESGSKRQKTDANEQDSPMKEVSFESILNYWKEEQVIEDFLSPATNQKGRALNRTRLKTFPRYLWMGIGRYIIGDDWQPIKLSVRIPVPEKLSLEHLRSSGKPSNEEELPEENSSGSGQPEPDQEIVQQLLAMGFPENGCKRAALAVNNSSAEDAAEWVMMHMEDPDFNTPLEQTSNALQASGVNEESVGMLTAMGFSAEHARHALGQTDNNLERAADWLFSHANELEQSSAAAPQNATPALEDGKGEYELVGFISHIGKNTGSGHYVCHLKRRGKWVIMNDRTVAESVKPPLDLGYLYLYRRTDAPQPSA